MATEPIWITEELVRAIHKRQLAEHGGIDGVRDEGLLSSALARPRHVFSYSAEQPNLARLATAYAFGLVKNHALLDGNKRTAAVVCETFIEMNGRQLTASDEAMYMAFIALAEDTLSEEELAHRLQEHLQENS